MGDIVLEISERGTENKWDAPNVRIKQSQLPSYSTLEFSMFGKGVEKYMYVPDEFKCDSLSAMTKIIDHFHRIPNKDRYRTLYLTDETFKTEKAPNSEAYEVLSEFINVKHFVAVNGIPKLQLQSYFPNLEALDISSWGKNKIAHEEGCWPNLKYLRADYISSLKPLIGWDLQTLFLVCPRIDDLEDLKHFPNLKTLMISGTGKPFDFSPLNHLKKLENLQFESRKAPIWGEFQSDSLKILMMDYVESLDVLKTLPNIECWGLYHIMDARDLEYQGGGDEYWNKHGDPFATILGPYFIDLENAYWGEDDDEEDEDE